MFYILIFRVNSIYVNNLLSIPIIDEMGNEMNGNHWYLSNC